MLLKKCWKIISWNLQWIYVLNNQPHIVQGNWNGWHIYTHEHIQKLCYIPYTHLHRCVPKHKHTKVSCVCCSLLLFVAVFLARIVLYFSKKNLENIYCLYLLLYIFISKIKTIPQSASIWCAPVVFNSLSVCYLFDSW